MSPPHPTDAPTWQQALADALAQSGVEVAVQVPDSRLDPVVKGLSAHDLRIRTLTREEECVGYAAGARLSGGRPLVLMQSSGLGNALNALGSLVIPYGLGIPIVISMRGTLGEANPSQVPIGRATTGLLDALAIQWFSIRRPDEAAGVARGAACLAYEGNAVAAILLEPELGGGRERR
jgi:sulfopyruvate decarboxylase alpha subunit